MEDHGLQGVPEDGSFADCHDGVPRQLVLLRGMSLLAYINIMCCLVAWSTLHGPSMCRRGGHHPHKRHSSRVRTPPIRRAMGHNILFYIRRGRQQQQCCTNVCWHRRKCKINIKHVSFFNFIVSKKRLKELCDNPPIFRMRHSRRSKMVFHPVRIFRRTGKNSFAVQQQGYPGIMEVHCVEQDWGRSNVHANLEDRLCRLGTRNMFGWDEGLQRMAPVVHPIDFAEGVQVELGEFDVRRRAFVQCRLRVVDTGIVVVEACTMTTPPAAVEAATTPSCIAPKRRMPFKWGMFSKK